MRISASDLYSFQKPSKCSLRVYLRHIGEPQLDSGPFEQVLQRFGIEHEKKHLDSLGDFVDLSEEFNPELRTREEVEKKSAVIYQPNMGVNETVGGTACEVVGRPDYFLLDGDEYVIRDSKISRRINDRDHPEIINQLNVYGWLFNKTFGKPPKRLEVHNGLNEIVPVDYAGDEKVAENLKSILTIKLSEEEPFEPVGWSKCNGCAFRDKCWPEAEARKDVAMVADLDQGIVRALRGESIVTVSEFVDKYDENSLAELQRPWGQRTQRVGKSATKIMPLARAMASGKEILIQKPDIPQHENYVMFDLEGLPPHLDELEKIYLWGMQVFGEKPSDFIPATADFGEEGDEQGWNDFLAKAKKIFDEYGDIRFVHWATYEKTYVKKYIERYGDSNDVGAKVLESLLDLLPIAKSSIALPLPSYSLKVVEKYRDVGFKRSMAESDGEWSIAKYIEATETNDPKKREEVMNEILKYNEEDLLATWAVFEWLNSKR